MQFSEELQRQCKSFAEEVSRRMEWQKQGIHVSDWEYQTADSLMVESQRLLDAIRTEEINGGKTCS